MGGLTLALLLATWSITSASESGQSRGWSTDRTGHQSGDIEGKDKPAPPRDLGSNQSAKQISKTSNEEVRIESNREGEVEAHEGGEKSAEEEEKEEAEEEEEEEHFSNSDIQVATMLLGSVTIVMGLFYLVNWPDDDIRCYAWRIISSTISIFTAVLMFQGINDVLKRLLRNCDQRILCAIHYCHFLVYLIAMQFVVAIISGALFSEYDLISIDEESWVKVDNMRADNGEMVEEHRVRNPHAKKSVTYDDNGIEVAVEKKYVEFEKRKRRMKCWATLLAHTGGFAAINAGGALHKLDLFCCNTLMAMIPVFITVVIISGFFSVFKKFRDDQYRAARAQRREGRRAKMADEEISEAENDILSLVSSFITVNVLRFAMTGNLPDEEGNEHPWIPVPFTDVVILYCVGVAFAIVAVGLVMLVSRQANQNEAEALRVAANEDEVELDKSGFARGDDDESSETLEGDNGRKFRTLLNTSAMCFAWCFLWATRWFAVRNPHIFVGMMGRVMMALLLSGFVGFLVFGLDGVDDRHRGSEDSKGGAQAIEILIRSLGVLVGFSWEHCFDGAVAAVSSKSSHPVMMKLVLGALVVFFIVPAWRRYVLVKAIVLEEMREKRQPKAVANGS